MIPELAHPKTDADRDLFSLHQLVLNETNFFAQPFITVLLAELQTYYPYEVDHYGIKIQVAQKQYVSVHFEPEQSYEIQLGMGSEMAIVSIPSKDTRISKGLVGESQLQQARLKEYIDAGYYFPITTGKTLFSYYRPYRHNLDVATSEMIDVAFTIATLVNNLAITQINTRDPHNP